MVAHGFHSFAVGFMEVEHISMSEYEKIKVSEDSWYVSTQFCQKASEMFLYQFVL